MLIALDVLDDHPDNANRMAPKLFAKLVAHLRQSRRCPPLIVRPQAQQPGRYQLLDGHHRARALREIGVEAAECEVWDVDDRQADVLLVTLNRLHGEDDPQRRGAILQRLESALGMKALEALAPEDAARLRKLMDAAQAPPPLAEPPALDGMGHAVTFFLTGSQRQRLIERLEAVCRNRSQALVSLMELGT